MNKVFSLLKKILGKNSKVNNIYFLKEYREKKEKEQSLMFDIKRHAK